MPIPIVIPHHGVPCVRDELLIGLDCVNLGGTIRWTLKTSDNSGCARILRKAHGSNEGFVKTSLMIYGQAGPSPFSPAIAREYRPPAKNARIANHPA